MIVPNLNDLKSARMSPRFCKCRYPDFFNLLQEKYPNKSFSEQCYLYYNNLQPHLCPICGKPTNFRTIEYGYSEFCSIECSTASKETREKTKQTLINRYGSISYNNRDKAEKTCLEKYGTTNPFAAESVKKKIKQTTLIKYGVEYPSQSPEIQHTRELNTLKKYGATHHMSLPDVQEKIKKTKLERYGDEYYNNRNKSNQTYIANMKARFPELIDIPDDRMYLCSCPHPECKACEERSYLIPYQIFYNRKKSKSELCTKLFPINSGQHQTNVEVFVRKILEDNGIRYEYENNNQLYDATTKKYKHIDFWLPDFRIGIECNGCRFHRTNLYEVPSKPSNYHMSKTDLAAQNGIRLIHIWEDWVINKPEVVESIIKSKLNLLSDKIYARKCSIESLKCPEFIEDNHIQGNCPCSVSYVLKYNNEVVACMTFGRRKGIVNNRATEDDWELLRFCTGCNLEVVGGAGKLLSRFIKDYNPTTIISFASRDISDGNLYKTLGFKQIGKPQPSYWYVRWPDYVRYHRSTFSKAKLMDRGWGKQEETEYEIMDKLKYYRLYDSGTTKWCLSNK